MADSIAILSDLQMNKPSLSNKKSSGIDDADCIEGQIDHVNLVSLCYYSEGDLIMPNQDTKLRKRMAYKAYRERKPWALGELTGEFDELKRKLDESRRKAYRERKRRALGELTGEFDELRRENDELRRKNDELSRKLEDLTNLITQRELTCFHTDQMNESISSKKKFTNIDDADCFGGRAYQGSPSGANTWNLGMQTGTSSGDIDQTAAGQLSAVKPGKILQKEIDQNYHKRTKVMANVGDMKSKLVRSKEISMELQKVKLESEQLKKFSEWFDQHIQKDAKSMEEFQSQISSLISINGSQNQHIHSFFLRLLDMYGEKDKLQKEIEYLKKLMTQQQSVDFDINQVSGEN